jgi:hypothetical protein
MAIMVLKDRGGSALTVMRYSIPPRYARAKTVIHSLAIAGSVDDVSSLSDVWCPVTMCSVRETDRGR